MNTAVSDIEIIKAKTTKIHDVDFEVNGKLQK